MGGHGSGRWRNHQKAIIAEDCIFLDTKEFHRTGQVNQRHSAGTLEWVNSHERLGSATYSLTEYAPDDCRLRLSYLAGVNLAYVNETIRLTATLPHYGGRRWWFECPACRRRARKLYLPAGAHRFACRSCCGLSYRSCQESHTAAGFFRRLLQEGLLPGGS